MQDDEANPGGCSPDGAPRSDRTGTKSRRSSARSATSGATPAAPAGKLRLHCAPKVTFGAGGSSKAALDAASSMAGPDRAEGDGCQVTPPVPWPPRGRPVQARVSCPYRPSRSSARTRQKTILYNTSVGLFHCRRLMRRPPSRTPARSIGQSRSRKLPSARELSRRIARHSACIRAEDPARERARRGAAGV